MKRFLGIVMAAAVVGGSMMTGTAGAASDCRDQWLEVYEVKVSALKEMVRIGESAPVAAEVTNLGQPVEGANVAFGAFVADKWYATGASMTKANGVATTKLKLAKDRMGPGRAELRAMAYIYRDEGSDACAGIGLYGYDKKARAFRVKR